MRAAQYVRMSTEHQQYSIENQQAAIAQYAQQHGFDIIRTYADPAKSGLDLAHRPGLRTMLEDVVSTQPGYGAILVYDLSRWGRFQDADESAYYEFLCKRAGVRVHYCAEPFDSQDESITTALLKSLKRTMAAEYLRELSTKVHAGQCRLASNGFKLGGRAGYGLRRLLLDSRGQPKLILRDGERKSLASERVTWTLGPEDEVSVVRHIFSLFLEHDVPVYRIARLLNEQGIRRESYGPWDHQAVFRILTHPKYTGCNIFNRASEKLGSKRVRNPRGQWVIRPNSFPAIVSEEVFNRTQEKLGNMVNRRSDERLLAELRAFAETHGKLTPQLLRSSNGVATMSTYVRRFGSLMRAYELIQYRAARYTVSALENRREVHERKLSVVAALEAALGDAGIWLFPKRDVFRLPGCRDFNLEIGRCFTTPNGHLRWKVRTRKYCPLARYIVIRLQPGNIAIKDFVVLWEVPRVCKHFTFSEVLAREAGKICGSVGEVVAAIVTR